MLYAGAGKRVKRGLFQALTKAHKKCVILFIAFILSLFFVNDARAEAIPIPNEQDEKTITVRASVPLTPEFIYSIKKNSSITLEKYVFVLDEEVQVRVKIVGGNNFPLRGHKINLQILNEREPAFVGEPASAGEKVVLVLFGETDNDGTIDFSFISDERLFGKNILRTVDITYGEDIVISNEQTFIVYKTADGQRETELIEFPLALIFRKTMVQ
jgi:hypothetical protein